MKKYGRSIASLERTSHDDGCTPALESSHNSHKNFGFKTDWLFDRKLYNVDLVYCCREVETSSSIGLNRVGFTWRRKYIPLSETSCFALI
jgi:hypothetical protein